MCYNYILPEHPALACVLYEEDNNDDDDDGGRERGGREPKPKPSEEASSKVRLKFSVLLQIHSNEPGSDRMTEELEKEEEP